MLRIWYTTTIWLMRPADEMYIAQAQFQSSAATRLCRQMSKSSQPSVLRTLFMFRYLAYLWSFLPYPARFPPVLVYVPGSPAAVPQGQKGRWAAAYRCGHLQWFREAVRHSRPPRCVPRVRDSDQVPEVEGVWCLHSIGFPLPCQANTQSLSTTSLILIVLTLHILILTWPAQYSLNFCLMHP